jgi:PAS domain S-box-containing protein
VLTENSNVPLILLVEDDDLHVIAIERSFRNADKTYRLEVVGTLREAIESMALRTPDLVLSDYKLPDGDGTQLLLAADDVCPVILMTAQGNEQIAVDTIRAGAQDYIVKSASAFENLPLTVKYSLATWFHLVARRKADEAILNAKKDWEETFDAVTDLISIIDADHNIIRVNKAMADRCELVPEELIGRKCHEVMHGTPDPHSSCPHARTMQYGIGYSEQIEEKRWDRQFDISVFPLFDNIGQIRACVHVARDITEQKRAEDERLALEAQFQQTQKLESIGVLAGGIAHDFNNILTVILGHCYIIDGDLDSEMNQKIHVKQIEQAARRAADLCHQMLSYAGKTVFVQTRINLWLIVDENVRMLSSAIKKNVSIKLDLSHAVPELMGDSAQIQQVVMNLIINAAEAIGDKNGTIRVALKKAIISEDRQETDSFGNFIPPGNFACLSVADDGCGMDEETQRRIFEPFYTTKLSGRGLGMSAVLGIIKSHDGSFQLFSTPGVGTTFKVYLPLTQNAESAETTPTTGFVLTSKANGTILLVDDEEAMILICSALLKAMGFSVISASNGREALKIYSDRNSEIDAVLLDLLMPEMGGIETYHELRKISPVLPIVICTGCNVEELLAEFDKDEKAALIQKPYNPVRLQQTLMQLI